MTRELQCRPPRRCSKCAISGEPATFDADRHLRLRRLRRSPDHYRRTHREWPSRVESLAGLPLEKLRDQSHGQGERGENPSVLQPLLVLLSGAADRECPRRQVCE